MPGTGQRCCRNKFLADCIKKKVPLKCESASEEWLSYEIKSWMEKECTEFTFLKCKGKSLLIELVNCVFDCAHFFVLELAVFCKEKTEQLIKDCSNQARTIKGDDEQDREIKCCWSHDVEECLRDKNLLKCFDERFTLANYWSVSRDHKNRVNCDFSVCGESFMSILLTIALVFIIITILIILLFLCMKKVEIC